MSSIAMSGKPMSAEDVRAILEGRKTNSTSTSKKSGNDWGQYTFFAHGIHKECATIEEALQTFEIDWTVRTVDLRSHSPSEPQFHNIDFFDHKGIIREDNNFPLSTVGATIYNPVQNRECMEMFEDIIKEGKLIIESGGVFDYGRRIWVACRLPEPVKIKFKSGDEQTILRYLHISWSHDQSQAITVSFMPYVAERKVSLASFVPSGVPCSVSFKHTKTAQERMKKSSGILAKALRFFQDAEEMLQKLASRTLTPERFDEMLSYLYPEPEEKELDNDGNPKKSKNSKLRDKIKDRWEKLPSDLQFTDFGAMLAVAEDADFEGRTAVRGSKEMSEDEKDAKQREKRLDSSLFGTAQKKKQTGVKVIFNFDKIKQAGGIKE